MKDSKWFRDSLMPYQGQNVTISGKISGIRYGTGRYNGMYCIKPAYLNHRYISHHIWFPITNVVRDFANENYNGKIPENTKISMKCYIDEYKSSRKIRNIGIKFIDEIWKEKSITRHL